jgi:hypothetical protein
MMLPLIIGLLVTAIPDISGAPVGRVLATIKLTAIVLALILFAALIEF